MREHGAVRRAVIPFLFFGLVSVACTGSSNPTSTPSQATTFALQVASSDLYTGSPQRVEVGVFNQTDQGVQLLTGGSIPLSLAPADGGDAVTGQARYVPAPGMPSPSSPGLTTPADNRGVYALEHVTFPSSGVWNASLSFDAGGQPVDLSTSFGVSDSPALPAPGDRAFRTYNLTMADAGADAEAVDSRAQGGQKVPDPDLHQDTIAAALAAHRPILALFATPVYCASQFCGPSTDALEQLSKAGPADAAYIHVEIYENHAKGKVNQAAAQWLLRNGNLTEPWLFLIGRDGKILDRWGPLFDPKEVLAELEKAAR
jgi:hypothetical protein